MTKPERLPAAAARRLALAAQGYGAARPAAVRRQHLVGLAQRLGMFQIDSVNVLARAHLMPAFSRLGPYDLALFEQAAWGRRRAWFEYWGHEASLLPVACWPLLRWRMEAAASGAANGGETARFGAENPGFIAECLAELRDRGALAAAELTRAGSARGKWWGWSDGKRAMEYLFWTGQVTVSHRRGAFERVYDLPERVLPPDIVAAPAVAAEAAQRGLLRIAAAAMGVATERDLLAYWRLKPPARARVAELVEAGELLPAVVEGWKQPAFRWHAARIPRRLAAHALVSPFDPLLWERDRALRVLDFHYRIGLYTPRAQRTDGYYVLPFLHGDRIAARVDLKADRAARVLRVHAAHLEPPATEAATAHALARELGDLARWLGLERVAVARQGNLAAALAAA
ncbi:MAG: YcaQ family DNA glycosylase [Rhodospirillales bacterium]|nr:YcaQ family DNA glycosylase [Rhodospirillales bacterium]